MMRVRFLAIQLEISGEASVEQLGTIVAATRLAALGAGAAEATAIDLRGKRRRGRR